MSNHDSIFETVCGSFGVKQLMQCSTKQAIELLKNNLNVCVFYQLGFANELYNTYLNEKNQLCVSRKKFNKKGVNKTKNVQDEWVFEHGACFGLFYIVNQDADEKCALKKFFDVINNIGRA
jgi:hypothetical protein